MKDSSSQKMPLARKEGLVIERLPDEVLVYDIERDRAHCLNETAAFVWQSCDGRTTTKEMARLLGKRVSAVVDEKVVWLALDQLGRSHLLKRRPNAPVSIAGINRREMVRALGLAAVVAVPVVTSIVAPTPVQAVTCKGEGTACSDTAECCPGLGLSCCGTCETNC
jgi:hypothetical protein